jgi:hypothetical protein
MTATAAAARGDTEHGDRKRGDGERTGQAAEMHGGRPI